MGTVSKFSVAAVGLAMLANVPVFAQSQTISARPGAVNNKAVSSKELRNTFLNPNDELSTGESGKAEILLTPGVFLRVGENSTIRMKSPSLTDTQIEVTRGEAMIEATGLVKDNHLQVIEQGSITTIQKNGLYRFTAGNPPLVSVLDGRALVDLEDRKIDLKKGRQTVIASGAKAEKFDRERSDDLYAWSNVRSEYEAASSYRVSQNASLGYLGGGGYGLGPGSFGSGWMWDSGFNSYAWLPGAGYAYNSFGYGFYSPGYVGYAPTVIAPIYGRGAYSGRPWNGQRPTGTGYRGGQTTAGAAGTAAVPVRPAGGWRSGAVGNAGMSRGASSGAAVSAARPSFGGGAGMGARVGGGVGGAGGGGHSAGGHGK